MRAPRWIERMGSFIPAGLVPLLLLSLSGCGGKQIPSVQGTVKYDGKPLPGGMLKIVAADGTKMSCNIEENGHYYLYNPPLGGLKIGIEGFQDQPKKGQDPPPLKLPARLKDPDTSGVAYTVTQGNQLHDIELTP